MVIELNLIIGLILIIFGLVNIIIIKLRKKWPETSAEVLLCNVTSITPEDLKAHAMLGSNSLNSIKHGNMALSKPIKYHDTFKPSLIYKYIVGDNVYLSQNMYSGPCSRLDTGIVRFFTAGSHYPVRYNPNDPESAYLMFSKIWPYVLIIVVGIGVVAYQPLLTLVHQLYAYFISNK